MSDSFNHASLDLARRRRGMTKTDLANSAGISTRILTSYLNGQKDPSPSTLEKLAKVLDYPIEFFWGDDHVEPPPDGCSFRALSGLSAKQRDQAFGSASVALSLGLWIDERFDLPQANIPRLRDVDPETAASEVRNDWGLGSKPLPNLIHLLEKNGVRVFSLAEECAEVDAFSFWLDGVPYVFLNTMKSAERSRMDAAHELGHLVLHWHGQNHGREAENEAQAFGSAFLMPRDAVVADVPPGVSLAQIIAHKQQWRVSVANLTYRLHKLELLSDWQYRMTFKEISSRGYRSKEPCSMPRERSKLLEQVLSGMRAEGVSRKTIAEDLQVRPEEINKITFGLTLTPIEGQSPNPSRGTAELRLVK